MILLISPHELKTGKNFVKRCENNFFPKIKSLSRIDSAKVE